MTVTTAADAAHQHFGALSRQQQLDAIRLRALQRFGDYTIAAETRLSLEQVRLIIGERE